MGESRNSIKVLNSIWITWEHHRRSYELAKAFGADFHVLLKSSSDIRNRAIRYAYLSAKSLLLLIRRRPKIVFAQNPSIVLALLLCLVKKIFGYNLIIDRHSNFKLDKKQSMKWKVFHSISRFTTRHADITIVTNRFLCDLVNSWKGKGYILQDKLPELSLGERTHLEGKKNIVFVSTFSEDEPIAEVISAARMLENGWFVYVTGNYTNYSEKEKILRDLPPNVRLTGFLPEKDYQNLLFSSDLILVMTTYEYLLSCGAYEGLSICKPMVLSDTNTIKDYFAKGVIYTKPYGPSIAAAIRHAIDNYTALQENVLRLKNELLQDWTERYSRLCSLINIL